MAGTEVICKRHLVLLLTLVAFPSFAASPETLFRLQTWGAPWEARFDVALESDGSLKATMKGPEGSETAKVALSQEETKALHELAKKAILEPALSQCDRVLDGTSGKLTVAVGSGEKSQECLNTSEWPPPGTIGEKLVKMVNERLPEAIQVY